MNVKTQLGEILQNEMKHQNLTIAQLVKKTGMSQSTISEILIGKRKNLTSDNLIKLSKGLNVSVDYLLGLEDVRNQFFAELLERKQQIEKEVSYLNKSLRQLERLLGIKKGETK